MTTDYNSYNGHITQDISCQSLFLKLATQQQTSMNQVFHLIKNPLLSSNRIIRFNYSQHWVLSTWHTIFVEERVGKIPMEGHCNEEPAPWYT